MNKLGAWIITALLFTVAGVWCGWMLTGEHAKEEDGEHEATTQPTATAPAPISHDEAGNVVVRFDEETQHRVGMQIQPLSSTDHRPEIAALGVLQEDPAHSFTLRAPLAGKIVPPPGREWPDLGSSWPADSVIGGLEPRLSPTELADLSARLADAQGNVEEVRAELSASRLSLESKKQLNAGQKVVSDQVLHEAEAAVRGQEARLEAALANVKILTQSLAATTQPSAAIPLKLPLTGRVVDSPAGPNESVESGQPLLRIANYEHIMARIALPAGSKLDEHVRTARIAITGHDERWFTGDLIALAPTVDSVTGGPAYLFHLSPDNTTVQPGMLVIAYLPAPGDPRPGVVIPRSAVIRYLGRTWVYVRSDKEAFTRREMTDPVPLAQGWFVSEPFKKGDQVVTTGAQSLLSEELRYQTTGTEEEE